MTLTYSDYLKLDALLRLQEPRSDGPEHDETLFIVIHQVYELWFKQVLHETRKLQSVLESGETQGASRMFKRLLTIWKTLVAQVDVLETMTPLSFLSFRSRLESASGFQSSQFRALEFVLGHRGERRLRNIPAEQHAILRDIMKRPSLYDSFLRFIRVQGYPVPEEVLTRDFSEPPPSSPELQSVLLQVYRDDSGCAQVAERMVDLDEGIQEWRYRHVKMVERTIGTKQGTGGSDGVGYLRHTLFQPLWPDLWAVRAQL